MPETRPIHQLHSSTLFTQPANTTSALRSFGETVKLESFLAPSYDPSTVVLPGACSLKSTAQSPHGHAGKSNC
eukprot:COSAG06_NODE_4686_length_4036_cov_7.714757_4_plen_73_part_00